MIFVDKSGQGHTILVLTDAESRLLRATLTNYEKERGRAAGVNALDAFSRGIQRGTERMAAEFKAEQAGIRGGKTAMVTARLEAEQRAKK